MTTHCRFIQYPYTTVPRPASWNPADNTIEVISSGGGGGYSSGSGGCGGGGGAYALVKNTDPNWPLMCTFGSNTIVSDSNWTPICGATVGSQGSPWSPGGGGSAAYGVGYSGGNGGYNSYDQGGGGGGAAGPNGPGGDGSTTAGQYTPYWESSGSADGGLITFPFFVGAPYWVSTEGPGGETNNPYLFGTGVAPSPGAWSSGWDQSGRVPASDVWGWIGPPGGKGWGGWGGGGSAGGPSSDGYTVNAGGEIDPYYNGIVIISWNELTVPSAAHPTVTMLG